MAAGDRLPGETAFRLYDTFGFPLDLTQDALRGRKIDVDLDGFNAAMAAQKAETRKAWAGSGETGTETLWFEIREDNGATEFLRYDTQTAEGRIDAIRLQEHTSELQLLLRNTFAVLCFKKHI